MVYEVRGGFDPEVQFVLMKKTAGRALKSEGFDTKVKVQFN